jgi:hypothetical protein
MKECSAKYKEAERAATVAELLANVPMIIVYGCLSVVGLAAAIWVLVVVPDYLLRNGGSGGSSKKSAHNDWHNQSFKRQIRSCMMSALGLTDERMTSGTDIVVLYQEFAAALTEVLAESAAGPTRRGRLARARAAVKKHPNYNEHEYFLAVEAAFTHWEAIQNVGRSA